MESDCKLKGYFICWISDNEFGDKKYLPRLLNFYKNARLYKYSCGKGEQAVSALKELDKYFYINKQQGEIK